MNSNIRYYLLAFAFAVAAFGAAHSQSTVFKGLSADEVKKHDAATWGKSASLSADAKVEYSALRERMNAMDEAVAKAGDDMVFLNPEKNSSLQAALAALQKPLVTNKKRLQEPPSNLAEFGKNGDDMAAKGAKALDTLTIMLERLDRNSRWKLMELVDYAATMEMPQRYRKWETIIQRLDTWKHSKTLAEFDAAFGKFMREIDQHSPAMPIGTTWLRVSGLNKFANADCRKEAFFDRDLRTIDSYLAVLRDTAIKAHKDHLNEFTTRWNAAYQAMKSDYEYFKQHGLDLDPSARKAVEDLTDSFSFLMLHAKDYIPKAKELILQADGGNAEVNKLRFCLIGPNKAFYCAGSIKTDGCPGYSRRVRVALEDCKNAYLKDYRKFNGPDAKWE